MRVIVLQDHPKLGKAGTIKEVKSGYSFNYLIPKGLVEVATPEAVKRAEERLAKDTAERENKTEYLKKKAALLSGKIVLIKERAKDGKLFGSVSPERICEVLREMDVLVESKHLKLKGHIKEPGTFPVEAHFGHGISAAFSVAVETVQ